MFLTVRFPSHRLVSHHVSPIILSAFPVQFQCGGSALVSNVVATNVGYYGQYNCGVPFSLTFGPGNVGWNDTHCGWPPGGR